MRHSRQGCARRNAWRDAEIGWRRHARGRAASILLCSLFILPLGGCAASQAAALQPRNHGTTGAVETPVSQATSHSVEVPVPGVDASGTPVVPQPLQAQTWAILNDTSDGLSLAYPSAWTKLGAITDPGGLTFANYDVADYPSSYLVPPLLSITVSIAANPQQLSPGDYYNTEISGNGADAQGPTTTSTTTLAGQDALVVTSAGLPGLISPSSTYYLPDGSLPQIVIVRVEDPAADTQGVVKRMLASLNLAD